MRYRTYNSGVDVRVGQSFEIGGVKYPKNWLQFSSEEEKTAIGLIGYEPEIQMPAPKPFDPRDYNLSRKQLRLGLLSLGVVDAQVEEAISLIPDPVEKQKAIIEWEDASYYQFDHPLIQQVGQALGVSLSQMSGVWSGVKGL